MSSTRKNRCKKPNTMGKKILLILTAFLAGLGCASKALAAFDRLVASERYRAWYARMQADIATVDKQVPAGQQITEADVAHLCEGSVVPGSRGTKNLVVWLNQARKNPSHTVHGEIAIVGEFLVLMHMFEQATPAGEGGLFLETQGNRFPDRSLQVIYMDTRGCDGLDSVSVGELSSPTTCHRLAYWNGMLIHFCCSRKKTGDCVTAEWDASGWAYSIISIARNFTKACLANGY